MFGLKDTQIQAIQSVFKNHSRIIKAVLYGSRAKGNYRSGSDIDITLIGDDLDLSTLARIEHELDELFLPYKIDLSLFHQIKNPDLIDHINRIGIVVYEKAEA